MAQILKIKDLVRDINMYPRHQVNEIIVYKYAMAMKAGARFPPVIAAQLKNKYFLLDGWHRVEALHMNKEQYVQAEILTGLTKDEMFIEAVRRNVTHGHQLTSSEIAKAISRMQGMKISTIEISKIIHIPTDKIEPFMAKRITNTVTGEVVFLKKGVTNMAGTIMSSQNAIDVQALGGLSQNELLSDLIMIVKNGWLKIDNKVILAKAKTLYNLLSNIMMETPIKSKRKGKK